MIGTAPEFDAVGATEPAPDPVGPAPDVTVPEVTLDVTPAREGRYLAVVRSGGEPIHRDTLDLNSALRRDQFAGRVVEVLLPSAPDDARQTLRGRLIAELLAWADAPPGEADGSAAVAPPPTPGRPSWSGCRRTWLPRPRPCSPPRT